MPVVVVHFQDGGKKHNTTCGVIYNAVKSMQTQQQAKQVPNADRIRNSLHVVITMLSKNVSNIPIFRNEK